jgi:hypothetical protein
MSSASDIANLFEVAGASPSQYQEVERTEQMQGLRGDWTALNASEPELVAPEPAAQAPLEAAVASAATETTETAPGTETADTVLETPQPLFAWSIPAAASEPPPVAQTSPVEPVIQPAPVEPVAQPAPAPVVDAPPPAALSGVFARLMERNEPREGAAPRGTP